MRMIKKTIAILAILVMVAFVIGCAKQAPLESSKTVIDKEVSQTESDVSDVEDDLSDFEDIDSDLDLDELDSLDADLDFEI